MHTLLLLLHCSLLQVMDANKDGFITFDEFATWWSARKKS
jgi:Ca2+-binding EF-hand superfamily protein